MTEVNHGATTQQDDSHAIKRFVQLKERLLGCIGRMNSLKRACGYPCAEIREKLETNSFNLMVVGQFKRGKTHLINALMGADLLPVSVVPLTSIVTIMTFGEQVGIRVFLNDGSVREIGAEELQDYVTETGNPGNEKNVREVVVTYPSDYLKDGVRLMDTPGVGSVFLHNTDVAYRYLPQSDAALFLLSVDQPVSRAELDFLADVRQYADRIFFLLNKIDYLSDEEVRESVEFSRKALEEIMGPDIRIFPVSARLGLQGQLEGSAQLLERSNLPAFTKVLDRFLLKEKGQVLILSVSNQLLRILSQIRLEMELELKSLMTPLEDLKEKISAFQTKKEEILGEKESFAILMDGEVDRLIRNRLDEDIAAFKKEFAQRMERDFEEFYEKNRELSLKELNDALEDHVVEEVERAFTQWREVEDEKLAAEFQAICSRFVTRMNETVDTLLSYSSELFSIRFEVVRAESVWTSDSGFYYKLREEPVGLDMLAVSLTQVVPGYIGNRFQRLKAYVFNLANRMIVSKRKRHMIETIDMQAGRIRFDFVDRLNRSKLKFRSGIMKNIEATVEGIGSAIEKGMELKSRSEEGAAEMKAALLEGLGQVEELRGEVESIKEAAGKS